MWYVAVTVMRAVPGQLKLTFLHFAIQIMAWNFPSLSQCYTLDCPQMKLALQTPPPPPIQLYRYGLVLGLRLIKFVFQLSSILKFALILTVTNWITRKTWNQWLKCLGHTQLNLHVVFCCVVFKDTWSSWPSSTAPSSPIVLYPRSNPMMNVLLLNVLYNISASYI